MKAVYMFLKHDIYGARRAAKQKRFTSIYLACKQQFRMSNNQALYVALYLKDRITYEDYCSKQFPIFH